MSTFKWYRVRDVYKGTFKYVKLAFLLVETEDEQDMEGFKLIPIARSVLYIRDLDNLRTCVQEMRMVQNFSQSDFQYICHKRFGLAHFEKNALKIYQFDPYAVCNLDELLNLNGVKAKGLLNENQIKDIIDFREGRLNHIPATLRQIIEDIARALEIMHERNIAHQDLKDENILIFVENGVLRAKVADFGIAEKVGTGLARGTVDICSPQIFLANESEDAAFHRTYFRKNKQKTCYGEILYKKNRESMESVSQHATAESDIFSFGMICVKILTGRDIAATVGNEQELIDTVELACKRMPLLKQILSYSDKERPTAHEIVREMKSKNSMTASKI